MNPLLIRAEDKNQWERRAPLTPDDVKALIDKEGLTVAVESSEKRFFPIESYTSAGAKVCTDMQAGKVILGVKEIPVEKIIDNRVYVFFSHTIKGQKDNMPLLQRVIDSGSTLIDYEKIVGDDKRRLVYFGRYAGDAGTIDILSLMGENWQAKGIDTPFARLGRAHQYESVAAARKHLDEIGRMLQEKTLPNPLAPLMIGILGYGNVAGGVKHILEALPHRYVEPAELAQLPPREALDPKEIIISVFKEADLVKTRDGSPFDLQRYYNRPEDFESCFEPFLPYFHMLINAVYWEKRYPRFVTWDGLKRLFEKEASPRLTAIADITCDTHGSIECNVRSTDSSMPAYRCRPQDKSTTDGHLGEGIVLLAVDNLPCEVPNDSSTFFSAQLRPLAANLARANFDAPLAESGLVPALQNAVIVYNGALTENFAYLNKHL